MTYATFDLTEHTQLSIRGTTGTHPDSEFVFGIYIGSQEHYAEELTGKVIMPDIHAYDDHFWLRATALAGRILHLDEEIGLHNIDDLMLNWGTTVFHFITEKDGKMLAMAYYIDFGPLTNGWNKGMPSARVSDSCDWSRAVEMAKWILEWDDSFKTAKELDTTVGIISDMRETYSKIDEWGGKWMKEEKE